MRCCRKFAKSEKQVGGIKNIMLEKFDKILRGMKVVYQPPKTIVETENFWNWDLNDSGTRKHVRNNCIIRRTNKNVPLKNFLFIISRFFFLKSC